MQQANYAFFQGKFVPREQANVNIMNKTFMYGLGVFEGIRGYWNEEHQELYLFRLREHIERMFDSMKIMHLSLPYTVDEICEIILELLRKNSPSTDMYVRPAVYVSTEGITPCMNKVSNDLCILTVPLGDYVDTSAGLKVQVSAWRRVEDNAIPARAKIIGSYVNAALAKTDASLAGFDECVVLSENGHVTEGSAMNLFMLKRGQLITTPLTENILEGITRNTIIEMSANELGISTISRAIDRSELYTAEELFFCGTGAQVAPIASVDNRPIGDGLPGALSVRIRDLYIDICRGNQEKYHKWLTPVFSQPCAVMEIPVAQTQLTA